MTGKLNGRTGPVFAALTLFAVSVLLVVAGTGYAVWQGERQAQRLGAEIRAVCAEQADIGTVPAPAKPTELGVKLIVDFRAAYAGLGCAPALPPPSELLVRQASKYGIPVSR